MIQVAFKRNQNSVRQAMSQKDVIKLDFHKSQIQVSLKRKVSELDHCCFKSFDDFMALDEAEEELKRFEYQSKTGYRFSFADASYCGQNLPLSSLSDPIDSLSSGLAEVKVTGYHRVTERLYNLTLNSHVVRPTRRERASYFHVPWFYYLSKDEKEQFKAE